MKVKDINPTGIRMQPELREWLKQQAKLNQRSLNNEIVFRLEESMKRQEQHEKGA